MSYLGNTPTTQGFSPAIDYFSGNGSTTAFTLSRPVASNAQVQAVVNNVSQNPSTAFTVSGNTITFTGAPSAGTNNIYVQYTSPITQVNTLTQGPSIIGPMYVSIGGGSPIGGATNPIMGLSGAANNYVQGYVNNTTNGVNSSADFVAYPSNGTDASGWIDIGITSPSYSQAAFSVTGPNETYLFGSAPSGSGTTGNLVYATDSTGTTNAHQWYVGGFNQPKSAWRLQLLANALQTKGALQLFGSTSGYVGLQGAAAAGSTTYTLPAADGTSGQLLATNGSGLLSWASASPGTSSLAASGYQRINGGIIIQWGKGSGTQTFPIAFPTACVSIAGMEQGSQPNTWNTEPKISAMSTTSFSQAGDQWSSYNWIAIGY